MYENITYEVLLQRMLDRVSDKLDKRESSLIWDTHSATAIELQILYLELEALIKNSYGDTATREFLILLCRDRGIVPKPATKAILKGKFTPAEIDVVGKRFNIDSMNYTVVEKSSDGWYEVQCEMEGTIGNRYLGTMIPVEYIAGLKKAELTEVLIPGEDEEDTEELRKRYYDSFDTRPFGGNRAQYQEQVNAFPGVGCTKVEEVWNSGIRPADMIPTTEVEAWYHSVLPTLNKEIAVWLTAVYTAGMEKKLTTGGTVMVTILDSEFNQASQTLVEAVQEYLDPQDYAGEGSGIAPIGHVVSVRTAEAVEINVVITPVYETGYEWQDLQDSITNAMEAYLLELRKSWPQNENLIIRINQIKTRLMGIKGILDVASAAINDREENLILGNLAIPVLGSVST